MRTSIVSDNANISENVKIGNFCIIEDNVTIEEDVIIGNYCHIRRNVKIGKGTKLMNHVELRPDTTIGDNCYVDSGVRTSGNVIVKDNVTLRYETILARGVVVGSNTYICPRVMTNNLSTEKDEIGGAKIGDNCFIGTNAVLQHGITIGDDVVIGAMSFVSKNCESNKTYVGIPARLWDK